MTIPTVRYGFKRLNLALQWTLRCFYVDSSNSWFSFYSRKETNRSRNIFCKTQRVPQKLVRLRVKTCCYKFKLRSLDKIGHGNDSAVINLITLPLHASRPSFNPKHVLKPEIWNSGHPVLSNFSSSYHMILFITHNALNIRGNTLFGPFLPLPIQRSIQKRLYSDEWTSEWGHVCLVGEVR